MGAQASPQEEAALGASLQHVAVGWTPLLCIFALPFSYLLTDGWSSLLHAAALYFVSPTHSDLVHGKVLQMFNVK